MNDSKIFCHINTCKAFIKHFPYSVQMLWPDQTNTNLHYNKESKGLSKHLSKKLQLIERQVNLTAVLVLLFAFGTITVDVAHLISGQAQTVVTAEGSLKIRLRVSRFTLTIWCNFCRNHYLLRDSLIAHIQYITKNEEVMSLLRFMVLRWSTS